MARLFWLIIIVAFFGVLLTGASWAAAYTTVGSMLGAPPPKMGTQSTRLEWRGVNKRPEEAVVWRFVFRPTAIPGASTVRIYVNPLGRLLHTEPPDLQARLRAFHNTGY